MSARATARRRHAGRRSKGAYRRVDTRRARRHLRRLAGGELGRPICPERAAKLAGLSPRETQRLLQGRGRESVRTIPRDAERRILAVTPQGGAAAPAAAPSPPPSSTEELPWPWAS